MLVLNVFKTQLGFFSQSQHSTHIPFANAVNRYHLTWSKSLSSSRQRSYTVAAAAVAVAPLSENADSFLHGSAANYIDEMYATWKQSPEAVHVSWQTYFKNMEDKSIPAFHAFQPPPGLVSPRASVVTPSVDIGQPSEVLDHLKVQQLIRAYQARGHYLAKTDPLSIRTNAGDIRPYRPPSDRPSELQLAHYCFTTVDLDREFNLGPGILPRFVTASRKSMKLKDIIAACETTYCGSYGVEYLHIPDRAKCDWLRDRLEVPRPINFSRAEKSRILDGLIWGTLFERFLAAKFPTEKRFGLDGSEGLVPGVIALIDRCVDVHGVESVVVGSCHRGRLTMLPTVYGKPPEDIFAEFAGRFRADVVRGMAGDVKYHLGHDGERVTPQGNRVSLSVLSNPSHLEAVDPVATGKAYATQQLEGDVEKKRVMCLALHGDAAIAGQGIVYETMGLSRLPAYDVGGTVRLIVNNQVGFTTDVHNSRSTPYASDIAKFVDAPILHVNADDVESLVFLCQLAADWRAAFHSDCVLDIMCYRKYGHNEFDQPSYTQPLMYQKVESQTPSLEKYIEKLIEEGSCLREDIDKRQSRVWDDLNKLYKTSKNVVSERKHFPPAWSSLQSPQRLVSEIFPRVKTSADQSILQTIVEKVNSVPHGFELHKNLQRILDTRQRAFDDGIVDWSTAEALALGTLCLEGTPVRFTGQDVQRGTFSQRHSVLHDQITGATWTPLSHLDKDQAPFVAENSPLSEFGAMGFEYGVTLADPHSLVVWEAQFGDFANNSQVIIDNFLASGESKWLDRSGLVLSLPHGYDGQGAEHSSARIERFLMLCNEDGRAWPQELERIHQDVNIGVVYMTTPANYFHVLRRQMHREYRKPLIIFFSKSLLRHPLARSNITEFTGSSSFQPVITDPEHGQDINSPESISRVVLCTGQVFATLQKHRKEEGIKDIAITRIEELHPFPWTEIKTNLDMYPNAKTIVWAQEEHYNGGAWSYVRDRIDTVLRQTDHHKARRVVYTGRGPSASTAAGIKNLHATEEKGFLEDVFTQQE